MRRMRLSVFFVVIGFTHFVSGCGLFYKNSEQSPYPMRVLYQNVWSLLDTNGTSVANSWICKEDRARIVQELENRGLLSPKASVGVESSSEEPTYKMSVSVNEYDETGVARKRVIFDFEYSGRCWHLLNVFG